MEKGDGRSAAERHEACREIDEGCSRAMAVCVDMIDAASAIGVGDELNAVRDALQRLHATAVVAFEYCIPDDAKLSYPYIQ
ncbi:hypothetical protein PQR12_23730 [Paraburkholderia nemoris]|uniref:hypothetical protein n=1 Tax=Paraburkholderia nemoris TaxID=2793076 RepID=UPI0038B896A0